MWNETELDFAGLESWLQARLGRPIDVHIVTEGSTVGFIRGPIERVMRFEGTDSRGLMVDGGAGAWTLELAEEDFVSALLMEIPAAFPGQQLKLTMRHHELMFDPVDAAAG